MNKLFAGALGLVGAVAMAVAAMAASWDMPTPYPENNFHTRNIETFAKDVKAATGGALEIRVHSNQSLFKHPEIKNAVRAGQVPIGEVLVSRLGNKNPVLEADSVPFLATDYEAARALWQAQRPSWSLSALSSWPRSRPTPPMR